jgi:hypothetical protein
VFKLDNLGRPPLEVTDDVGIGSVNELQLSLLGVDLYLKLLGRLALGQVCEECPVMLFGSGKHLRHLATKA